MRLWRLSGAQHAAAFDGGYGLLFDGRWNTLGHAVTYCATSPALCVLEKLVHIEDPELLPALMMVSYDVPDDLTSTTIRLEELDTDWRLRETDSQRRGDAWHRACETPLLRVPSTIVPISGSPDVNVLINHTHPLVGRIVIRSQMPFSMDARLF